MGTVHDIRTLRSLREIPPSRDNSNHTLKFNRTMAEAGLLGPLEPVEDDSPSGWLIVYAMAVIGAIGIGGLVWLLFWVTQ